MQTKVNMEGETFDRKTSVIIAGTKEITILLHTKRWREEINMVKYILEKLNCDSAERNFDVQIEEITRGKYELEGARPMKVTLKY